MAHPLPCLGSNAKDYIASELSTLHCFDSNPSYWASQRHYVSRETLNPLDYGPYTEVLT